MGIYTAPKNIKYMVFEYVDGGNAIDYLVINQSRLTTIDLLDM